MSDSWISWKPRIDEPSKPRPDSKSPASKAPIGNVMCCQVPGRSTNFRSTISTPRSAAKSSTSAGLVAPAAIAVCSLSVVATVSSFIQSISIDASLSRL